MVQLSKRLQAVAGLAGEAEVVADVGTDHGYIPLYLVGFGKAKRAIAMDVNEGPLLRAREHIRQYHMEGRIETRLSDGLDALRPGEAQAIVVAGMGGALMMRILSEGERVARAAKRLVLQPQSELPAFRRFLALHGYRITDEEMVYEDGKFYSMMAAKWTQEGDREALQAMAEADYKYGPLLLKRNHPVLRLYLLRQKEQKQGILQKLGQNARQDVKVRRAQLEGELEEIEALLNAYKNQEEKVL